MRIIGGEYRSRRLLSPKDAETTRPIPDRVKESLFGLLRGHCEDAAVFDGFAGTGAIGLEAISRGAARCVFVERDRDAAEMLRQNIESMDATDRCELVIGDALGPGALARCPRPANLIFLDPPYPLVRDPVGWKRVRSQFERMIDLLADDGFAIIRTPWPFLLDTPSVAAPIESIQPAKPSRPDRGPRTRRAKERDKRRGTRWEDQAAQEEVEIDLDPASLAKANEPVADLPPEPDVEKLPGDLTFTNAAGPETHIYSSMAVHLYMKKKPAPAG